MWKIRHEGSPQHLEMKLEEIQQGLVDGAWEVTDEVMGPGETEWKAIEAHPQLEELAQDIEPPPPPAYDDETRLDMNALIDVCLVLLVFFMLTTTVAALQVRMEAPNLEEGKARLKKIHIKDAEAQAILCKATMENGKPVVRVEDTVIEMHRLTAEFKKRAKAAQKSTLMIEDDGEVPHETVVKIVDAAKAAGMGPIMMVVPQ